MDEPKKKKHSKLKIEYVEATKLVQSPYNPRKLNLKGFTINLKYPYRIKV